MKSRFVVFAFALLLGTLRSPAQGTLEFDQQSTTGIVFEGFYFIQSSQPVGQSFTPSLNGVGFVQLYLEDGQMGNSQGATIYVNLLANSITGPIIAQTTPVSLPDNFEAAQNFVFTAPVPVTPGTTYYLQPVVQTGDPWIISESGSYHYSGGSAISGGITQPGQNLYFREGILAVPEPSTWALLLLGGGASFFLRRRKAA